MNIFTEPVVIHFVDFINQNESRFRIVVSRGHDDIPQTSGADFPVNLAGDPSTVIGVIEIRLILFSFLSHHRERQRPVLIIFNRFHEFAGDQQGQVELPQPTRFALGADEFQNIGMGGVGPCAGNVSPARAQR